MPTYKPLSKEEREDLRQRALAGPVIAGSREVLSLMAESDRLRGHLARAWAAWLEGLLDARLEDGTPLIEAVFQMDDSLRKRTRDVIMRRDQ